MRRVLFLTPPLQPPWNHASKNLAATLVDALQHHRPLLASAGRREKDRAEGRGEKRALPARLAPKRGALLRAWGRSLREERFDLVHAFFTPSSHNMWLPWLAREAKKTPFVLTVCSPPQLPRRELSLRLWRKVDRFVVLSRSTQDLLRASGLESERVVHIPPALSLRSLPDSRTGAALRAELGFAATPLLVYPGDLEYGGGAELAIRALRALARSEAQLVMLCRQKSARATKAQAELVALSERLGLRGRVHWWGESAARLRVLACADLVLMPNPSSFAKMDYPLVVLEAMAMARPVLVAQKTPVAELAEGGGVLAVDAQTDSLAAQVEHLLGDEAARRALGERARKQVARDFDPLAIARRYEEEVYRALY